VAAPSWQVARGHPFGSAGVLARGSEKPADSYATHAGFCALRLNAGPLDWQVRDGDTNVRLLWANLLGKPAHGGDRIGTGGQHRTAFLKAGRAPGILT
jgi:hypothetical protein